MFKNSVTNFKEIAKDAKVFAAGFVSLIKDIAFIPVEFVKDMKEIVNNKIKETEGGETETVEV